MEELQNETEIVHKLTQDWGIEKHMINKVIKIITLLLLMLDCNKIFQ